MVEVKNGGGNEENRLEVERCEVKDGNPKGL